MEKWKEGKKEKRKKMRCKKKGNIVSKEAFKISCHINRRK